jgi:hypothetical protein
MVCAGDAVLYSVSQSNTPLVTISVYALAMFAPLVDVSAGMYVPAP